MIMAKRYFMTADPMKNITCTHKVPQSSRKSGSAW